MYYDGPRGGKAGGRNQMAWKIGPANESDGSDGPERNRTVETKKSKSA